MDEHKHKTDNATLALLGQRMAQHRLAQNRTQAELASEAGVSKRTIERLEGGESTQLTNLIRLLRALGLLDNLDALVPPPAPSPLELLQSKKKRRKRASGRSAPTADGGSDEWSWGDDERAES